MLSQSQISEFKEAFSLIDRDEDGFIQKDDLKDILLSLGQQPTDDYLNEMLDESTGNINFTMFLTMFGERMNDGLTEDKLAEAFRSVDPCSTGKIPVGELKSLLTTIGDKVTFEEFEQFADSFTDCKGNFDYQKYLFEIKLA